MHSAIDVSSVHCPGFSRKGPPPTMSVIGSKVPAHLNSFVVPTASPTAKPMRAPRARERKSVMPLVWHRGLVMGPGLRFVNPRGQGNAWVSPGLVPAGGEASGD